MKQERTRSATPLNDSIKRNGQTSQSLRLMKLELEVAEARLRVAREEEKKDKSTRVKRERSAESDEISSSARAQKPTSRPFKKGEIIDLND